MIKPKKNSLFSNLKSILIAIFIALLIRSFIFEPFNIPSGSMKPNLLVGDFIFVSKYSYGFSKHSLPFSIPLIPKKIFSNTPVRGDVVVFKTPENNRTDYIKRLIGLPGDEIQFINGDLFINGNKILREKSEIKEPIRCGNFTLDSITYIETLPNGVKHLVTYNKTGSLQNTKKYIVPPNHYFLMGDNRDCSKDSRFLEEVGYVNNLNLVGKAKIIFFSNDTQKGSLLKFWNLHNSFRLERLFKSL